MNHFSGRSDVRLSLLVSLLLAVTGLFASAQGTRIDELQRGFEHPPENTKIMMRWWWFGPAVTKPELEREMRLMKEGGIGGFEVQPTYPLLPDDPALGIKNLPFLSDEFLDALRFTSDKAKELGLRMDLTLGSGWPFGGAQVPVNDAAGMLRTERVKPLAGIRRIPVPNITAGEKFIAVFEAPAKGQPGTSANWHEVKDIRDGAVWLSTEPGDTQE